MIGQFVICRSRDQGVVCGYLRILVPTASGLFTAELDEARQIWNWQDGCRTLFEMANCGPGVCRISEPLGEGSFIMGGICGVYPCSEQATENLRQSRWDESYKPSASSRRARKPVG